VAVADSYPAGLGIVDNTQFVVTGGSTVSPSTPFVGGSGRLTTNDLPSGGTTATAGTVSTTMGGSVTIAADGTFIYTPKANPTLAAVTADSFHYTISSDTGGTGTPTTAQGTANLALVGRVWYVLNNVTLTGNGQSQSPFKTLAEAITTASLANDVIYVYQGDTGIEITYKGPHPEDPKDLTEYLRRRHFSLDWVLRKWLSEPGIALFYEGQTVAEEKPVEQVTVMNAHNEGVTLYLNTDDHLPVKKSYSWRDTTDKQRNIEDEVYDNYREVQGVMTPFTITRFYNGDMSGQRFLTAVSYNQGISDSRFEATALSRPKKP